MILSSLLMILCIATGMSVYLRRQRGTTSRSPAGCALSNVLPVSTKRAMAFYKRLYHHVQQLERNPELLRSAHNKGMMLEFKVYMNETLARTGSTSASVLGRPHLGRRIPSGFRIDVSWPGSQ
jgi:hypothetical protein